MRTPDCPLYKFLSVSDGLTPSWQDRLSLVLDGGCYLSSAGDFNDPFDCLPHLASPQSAEDLDRWVDRMAPLMAAAQGFKNIPASAAREYAREIVSRLTPEEFKAGMQTATRQMAEAIGVFCLAESLESVLMWSHYASNHQGVAVRYDFSLDREVQPWFFKVRYQDDRPTLIDQDFGRSENQIAEALSTKASFWSYEQEWRIMLTEAAGRTIQVNPVVITGVVLGAKCKPQVEQTIRALAKARGIPLRRVVPDEQTFALRVSDA